MNDKMSICLRALLIVAALASHDASAQNAPLVVINVTAPPYNANGNDEVSDQAAFEAAIAHCAITNGCTIYIPNATKSYVLTAPLDIQGGNAVSFVGESKNNTALHPSQFNEFKAILNYKGTAAARISNIEIRNLAILGETKGAFAREGIGIQLSWVTKSRIDNVLFQSIRTGVHCKESFSNTFSNNNTNSLRGDAYLLDVDCNNNTFLDSSFGSARNGIHVVGAINGLSIIGSNCEDVPVNGYCVYLDPPADSRIEGVNIQNTHFELVRGAALYAKGAAANSIVNLKFDNNFVAGSYRSWLVPREGAGSGEARYAVILKNVLGFEASNNVFFDWQLAAFCPDGTESNGSVERNTLIQPDGGGGMKLTDPEFRPSVRVTNNAKWVQKIPSIAPESVGRQETFRSTIPLGACNVGDIAWNVAPISGGFAGWICATAGALEIWKPFGAIQ